MTPVAIPADRRFRRAHVKPARPRRSWRTVIGRTLRFGLVAGLLLFGGYRGAGIAAQSHVLQIKRIVLHGNERLSNGEVLAVLGGLRGQSLLWADLDVWRRRLLSSPWVRDADLRRSLPSTVEVVVSERRPIGIGRLDGQMYLFDEHGVIIDEYGPQYADVDLPVVDGLSASAGAGTIPGRAELAARVIEALRPKPEIARQVSQVDVRDPHNAAVILSGDPALVQLGDQRFLSRLQSYLELAPALRERVSDIDYVDLRIDGRIYVRPAGHTERPGRGPTRASEPVRKGP
jgi:cell division septal protein FtsQ